MTLQQLLRELRPYLSERAPQVWRWRHSVFEDVSRQRHARYLAGSHLALAAFFSGRTAVQPLILPKSQLESARYNLRVLEELPWQLAKCVSEQESAWPLQELRTTVATLAFLEAACAADTVVGVLRTFPRIEAALQAEMAGHWHVIAESATTSSGSPRSGRRNSTGQRKPKGSPMRKNRRTFCQDGSCLHPDCICPALTATVLSKPEPEPEPVTVPVPVPVPASVSVSVPAAAAATVAIPDEGAASAITKGKPLSFCLCCMLMANALAIAPAPRLHRSFGRRLLIRLSDAHDQNARGRRV